MAAKAGIRVIGGMVLMKKLAFVEMKGWAVIAQRDAKPRGIVWMSIKPEVDLALFGPLVGDGKERFE